MNTNVVNASSPTSAKYWSELKDLSNEVKLELISLLSSSMRHTKATKTDSPYDKAKIKLDDLEIPAKLRRKRGCIKLTEEDLKDERIKYILNK